jgi:hypothetical protein
MERKALDKSGSPAVWHLQKLIQVIGMMKNCCHLMVQKVAKVGFEVLTVVVMKSSIFWDIMTFSLLKVN